MKAKREKYKPTITVLRMLTDEIITATGEHHRAWWIERDEPNGYVLMHMGRRAFPEPLPAAKLYPLMRQLLAKLSTPPTSTSYMPPAAPEPEYMPPNKGRKGRKPDSLLNQPEAWESDAQK